jgi:hypothetical protein
MSKDEAPSGKMAPPMMRLLFLLGAAACAACAAHTGPMTIPLRWAPSEAYAVPAAGAEALRAEKLRVDGFVDERDEKTIGKNTERHIHTEKGDEAWTVSTPDDVGAFFTDSLRALLARNGVPTVAEGATRVLKGEVKRFFVTEGNRYQGDVVVHFVLEDGAGKTLWQGVSEGHVTRFGGFYKPENYQEALSDAFAEAVTGVLGNQSFLQAYGG